MAAKELQDLGANEYKSQRRALELERVQLEIRKLGRSPWLQPGLLSPLVVAALGLGAAYLTGWFDFRRETIRLDVEKLTKTRDDLEQQIRGVSDTLEQSKCALGLERWEVELLRDLTRRRAGSRNSVASFLEEWRRSGVGDILDFHKQCAMQKGGFDDDYTSAVIEGSDILAKRPLVAADSALHLHDSFGSEGAHPWSFVGLLSAERTQAFIFVLAWVRTPEGLGGLVKSWEEFPDVLDKGAQVEVKSPFTAFYSARISQDEDVYAICRNVGSEKTLQEALIERGLAVYFRGQSNAPYGLHRRLEDAQRKAKAEGAGFWGGFAKEMTGLSETKPAFIPD